MIELILTALGGYAIGSIPTGYWMGRALKGIDIRTVGSGNVGATNVFRSVGRAAGVTTLLLDGFKGFLVVWLAISAVGGEAAPLIAGVSAVAGHSWSAWVRFRGGKGVATSAGVFFALLPGPTLAAVGVFSLVFALSRRVSAGSMAAALALPVLARAMDCPRSRTALAAVVGALVLVRHLPNIRRLLSGKEPPLDLSRKIP